MNILCLFLVKLWWWLSMLVQMVAMVMRNERWSKELNLWRWWRAKDGGSIKVMKMAWLMWLKRCITGNFLEFLHYEETLSWGINCVEFRYWFFIVIVAQEWRWRWWRKLIRGRAMVKRVKARLNEVISQSFFSVKKTLNW